jgi:ankyrin repeat protein
LSRDFVLQPGTIYNPKMDWRLLHHACWAGDAPEVRRLLAEGADPNRQAPTNWRQRPLHRTLEFRRTEPKHEGHSRVVEILLEAGANASLRATALDMTPWELACFGGMQETAKLLRKYQRKAEPHPGEMTPLWHAAASRLPEPVALRYVRRVLKDGGDVNVVWRAATPLMMAVAHAGHLRVGDALIRAGADPNAGVSLMHASCEWHLEHLVSGLEYMHKRGWRVNNVDAMGQTALHKAAFLGYTKAIRALLDMGADRALKDRSGLTALDKALAWRKEGAVEALELAR